MGEVRTASGASVDADVESQAAVAVHNLTVLAHVRALDAEHLGTADPAAWKEALARWRQVVDTDACWQWLEARIRALADPRLSPATITSMRRALPAAVLSVNGALAVRAFESGRDDVFWRHLELITGAAMHAGTVDQALSGVTGPVVERIRRECKRLSDLLDSDRREVPRAVGTMLDATERPLGVLDRIFARGGAVRDGARDDVALSALTGVIAAQQEFGDEAIAQELLVRARKVAATEQAVRRIDENLTILADNAEIRERIRLWNTCWFCGAPAPDPAKDSQQAYPVKMYGDVATETRYLYGQRRVTWKSGTVHIPRCANCQQRTERADTVVGSFFIAVVVVLIATVISLCTAVRWIGLTVGLVVCLVLSVFAVRANRPASRTTSRAKEFPTVVEQLRKGWRIGDKPPTN